MNKASNIEEQLRMGRPVSAFTEGYSMEPLLYEGKTHVILKPVSGELSVGELPIYKREDGVFIIHRIIGVDAAHYYTRGDNCVTCEKIPKEWMFGVVTEIFRNGKHIRVTDRGYRFYVKIWNFLYPLRKLRYHLQAVKKGMTK